MRHVIIDSAVGAGVFKHGVHWPQLPAVHNGRIVHDAQHLLSALYVFSGDVKRLAGLRFFEHLTKSQTLGSLFDSFRFLHRVFDADGLTFEIEFVEYGIVQFF